MAKTKKAKRKLRSRNKILLMARDIVDHHHSMDKPDKELKMLQLEATLDVREINLLILKELRRKKWKKSPKTPISL